MNTTLYLILAGWLAVMGVVAYLVYRRIQSAAHKREMDERLAALNPPPPGANHASLPATTYRLEPGPPPSKVNQPEQYAAYQAAQAKWKLWRQLQHQPIPE